MLLTSFGSIDGTLIAIRHLGRRSIESSKSHAVAQHVPYLRRYARALTGNQISGDTYVAATLEALVKDPGLLDTGELPRVILFRLYSTIWNSLAINGTSDPMGK
jgi:hypothetical protein